MAFFCGGRGAGSTARVVAIARWAICALVFTAGAAALPAPAPAGTSPVLPDLRPLLPIAASALPSVFVDPYELPGGVTYRFDGVIWNDGGALDVYCLDCGTARQQVMQVIWPGGIPTSTSPAGGPGLGGENRTPSGAVLVHTDIWRLEHAARYELLLPEGGSRLIEKVRYCLVDTYNTRGSIAYFSGRGWCQGPYGRMGISPQIGDLYTSRNPVQWIDISGLRPGLYTLRATANPLNALAESSTANNVLEETRPIPGAIADDITQAVPESTRTVVTLSGSVVAPEIKAIKDDVCSYYNHSCYIDALSDRSLAFTLVTPPEHGTLSTITTLTDTSASLTYSPEAGYVGPDSFTYTTTDSRNLTSRLATVSLGIGSSAPPPPTQPPAPPLPEPSASPTGTTRIKRTVLTGTRFADVVVGTRAHEVFRLLRGADRVRAGRGSDVVFAGPGPDVARGGPGADELYGGAGRDLLIGGRGNDRINAGDGRRDRIRCGPGIDTVITDFKLDRLDDDCEIVERKAFTGNRPDTHGLYGGGS